MYGFLIDVSSSTKRSSTLIAFAYDRCLGSVSNERILAARTELLCSVHSWCILFRGPDEMPSQRNGAKLERSYLRKGARGELERSLSQFVLTLRLRSLAFTGDRIADEEEEEANGVMLILRLHLDPVPADFASRVGRSPSGFQTITRNKGEKDFNREKQQEGKPIAPLIDSVSPARLDVERA
ncbi:hypothetical protein HZH68_010649 [Vespula germanica]|uniref:Uncharacterized protein n=1 Tax=Vespula germanica TaxID=30212 RepID=A0A834N2W6_VESGE|nr:hypothetical protein HZH68_010649 [Vespula germanica]